MKINIEIMFLCCAAAIAVWSVATIAQAPEVLWTQFYGGTDPESGWQVQETSDGGYVIVGVTESFGAGYTDVYLIKTDENGDTVWTRTYGGFWDDEGRSVKETENGGFALAGFTESFGDHLRDVYLIKTDDNGDTLWTRTYGIQAHQEGRSIDICNDGGFIIAGWTNSNSSEDIFITKTDSLGGLSWTRTFGGNNDERSWSVIKTSDGGYAVAGWTESTSGGYANVYVVKMDSDGDSVWSMMYGGTEDDEGRAIVEIPDEGFAIAGKTWSIGQGVDFYLVRIRPDGEIIWERAYGESLGVIGHTLARTFDGGFIVGGYTWNHAIDFMVRTDSNGDTLWTNTIFSGGYVDCRSVQQTRDGGYVVTGRRSDDIYLAKLASDQTDVREDGINKAPRDLALHRNYPNPFNASTIIPYALAEPGEVKIDIYDILGRKVKTLVDKKQPAGYHQAIWNAGDRSSGIYLYRIKTPDHTETRTMLLLR